MAEDIDSSGISDIVARLGQRDADAETIDEILDFMRRHRDRAAVAYEENFIPTALGFASELDDQRNRIHGMNVLMLGLREIIGEEASIAGAHQLTLDLAKHAQRLDKLYSDMLRELAIHKSRISGPLSR